MVPVNAPFAPCTFASFTTSPSSPATAGSAGNPSSYFRDIPIATVLRLVMSGRSAKFAMLVGLIVTVL